MVVSESVLNEVKEKVKLYDDAKEKIKERISRKIGTAIEKLKTVQNELFGEVEKEFGRNPFAEFLSSINNRTDTDAKRLLAEKKIPENFGPDEKSFSMLLKEIDSFRAWRDKSNPFDFVPRDLETKNVTRNSIALSWSAVNSDCVYEIELRSSTSLKITHYSDKTEHTFYNLKPGTEYHIRVRAVFLRKDMKCMWSDPITVKTNCLYGGAWKECPGDVDDGKKYIVNKKNPRIATRVNSNGYNLCTIIGNTYMSLNAVASWSIKILKSSDNNGYGICIGVAPFDIDQNDNINKCGWYFNCYYSLLCSGPPHNYYRKEYGPRKEEGEYVHAGDSVGVVVDTIKGELSFVLNGVNYGVAYEGIPLDKPLVPCVLLCIYGDSVELDASEVKENNVDNSIPVPSNITAKSITWDSITLTWDEVSNASFYQIEVDGSKSWGASTTNEFTKMGLLPETEHNFRVRTVRGSSVSEWSGVVKGKALKESFKTSGWKEYPGDDIITEYSVDGGNPRIATNLGSYDCTIIGNTYIPLNTVTSWSIKVLESEYNDGNNICIGVAPSDINRNVLNYDDRNKCGWYFYCYGSALYSGPPHNYKYPGKDYGPRKGRGQYVHTGDSVGVVMDTTKGELSFVLNGMNLGVAYERIPLDKPLVPCVLLERKGDSVELII